MKMIYTRVVTKAALNMQRKSISTIVRIEHKTYDLIHHFLKRLKLTLQNLFSESWINILQSLTHYTRSLTETPSKLVYEQCFTNHKTTQIEMSGRNKNECPLNRNCKVKNVIYKFTISATQTFKRCVYLGIAEGNLTQRLYNHRQSFKDK